MSVRALNSVVGGSEGGRRESLLTGPMRLVVLAGLMFADPMAIAAAQEKPDQPATPGQVEPQDPDSNRDMTPPPAPATGATADRLKPQPATVPVRTAPGTINRPARPTNRTTQPTTPPKPPAAGAGVSHAQPVPTPGAQPNMPNPAAPAAVPVGGGGGQPNPPGVPLPPGAGSAPAAPGPQMGAGDVAGQLNDTSLKIGPFAEPVQVRLLVDLVTSALNLQVMDTGLALADKKVSLLTQIEVPREQLLDFLNILLEQNGQMMVRDVTGIFMIRPNNEFTSPVQNSPYSSTRLIPTPGIRPSALQQAIAIGIRPSGNPAAGAAAAPMQIAYLDDLGIILVTDTPRRIKQLEALIDALVQQQASMQWQRFPLRYLASNIARQRVMEILGLATQRTTVAPGAIDPNTGQPIGQPAQGQPGGAIGSLSSLGTRLTIDPQGNDLLLRGTTAEVELIRNALEIVDVPSRLVGKWYGLGGAAQTVAEQLKGQGLGQIITLQSPAALGPNGQPQPQLDPRLFGQQSDTLQGGSRFVIDPQNKGFMYYGTPEQQQRIAELLPEFEPLLTSDEVIYEFYPLKNGKAETVSEIVRGLISNQVPSADGGSVLLPGGRSTNSRGARAPRTFRDERLEAAQNQARAIENALTGMLSTETTAIEASDDVFVLPYKDTNTIVVKAPRKLQRQFAALIDKLDVRRPQVYIDVKVVVVTGSEDQRLAVETQLVNAAGQGGVLRTIFPPSPTGGVGTVTGNIVVPPVVNPLTGFTAALLATDMVPIVITAIANTTDARIVASPKILVDDNEEATIISKEERPTTTQTQTANDTLTGFGGYEEAGPELTVTPQISAGDYLRLKYSVNLSSFIGEGSPPPRQTNEVKAESVTVPSDCTIVVGGLTFDQERKTVIKVPLLGDIPLIGYLFRDERNVKSSSTVYVFITPRIMRDVNFEDVRLLTLGPLSAVKIDADLPEPEPQRMEIMPPSFTPEPMAVPTESGVPISMRREDEVPPPR